MERYFRSKGFRLTRFKTKYTKCKFSTRRNKDGGIVNFDDKGIP